MTAINPSPAVAESDLLTVSEAAQRLRVSERTIRRMIASGELNAPKVRRRRFVSSTAVQGLVKGEPEGASA